MSVMRKTTRTKRTRNRTTRRRTRPTMRQRKPDESCHDRRSDETGPWRSIVAITGDTNHEACAFVSNGFVLFHAEDQKENDAVADERACDVGHHPNERERDRHQYAGEEDTQRRLEAHDERLGERAFLAKMRCGGRVDDRSGEYSTDEKADEPSDD